MASMLPERICRLKHTPKFALFMHYGETMFLLNGMIFTFFFAKHASSVLVLLEAPVHTPKNMSWCGCIIPCADVLEGQGFVFCRFHDT
jgi:hypothetical protein